MSDEFLKEMADLLNSDGMNYTVFLKAYSGVSEGASGVHDIVSGLVGQDVVIDRVRVAKAAEVAEALQGSLGWVGYEAAGPAASVLASPEFSRLLSAICDGAIQLGQRGYEITSFRFAEGHPAYPVFWDFAYLFRKNDEHFLLVGSSSD